MLLVDYNYKYEKTNRRELQFKIPVYSRLLLKDYFLYDSQSIRFYIIKKESDFVTIELDGWDVVQIVGNIELRITNNLLKNIIPVGTTQVDLGFINLTGVDIEIIKQDGEKIFVEKDKKALYADYHEWLVFNIDGIPFFDILPESIEPLPILEDGRYYIVNDKVKELFGDRIDVVAPIEADDCESNSEILYVRGFHY